MTKSIGWLAIGGIFSFVAGAEAQTPPLSTATTAFDGTYAFVSSNEAPPINAICNAASERPGPLVIAQGRAEFTNLLGRHSHFEGTVGSQGELVMRAAAISHNWVGDIWVSGSIDRNGTVRVRTTGGACSYDSVWQKENK